LIDRYTRPAMGAIWTDENKFRCWLQVEAAASAVLAEDGVIPASAAKAIATKATVSAARVLEIESEVKHDVIAFTTAVAESPAGCTTASPPPTSSTPRSPSRLKAKPPRSSAPASSRSAETVLKKRAIEFKHTPIIGRTHGVHAEPTTFGLKLLLWYSEMQRNLTRFDAAAEDLRVGKLSGAVGTFGHLKPEHEEAICARIGLKPVAVATQVVQRDRHAAYIASLAILCSTLDKIATEIRHLQRTEVREAEEFFSKSRRAPPPCRTSATPSPASRSPASPASSAPTPRPPSRTSPSGTSATSPTPPPSASSSPTPPSSPTISSPKPTSSSPPPRLPERMLKNLESTGGLIFSGQLLLDLAAAGMSREDAYRSSSPTPCAPGRKTSSSATRSPATPPSPPSSPPRSSPAPSTTPASSPTSTPSSHLRNMTLAAEAGATIFPCIPAFYNQPKNSSEMAKEFACRVLAHFGLPQPGAYVWKPEK
jgi:adenylosuccinate lyase